MHIIFKALSLHTLEYRRLQHDLIYVYKILFGRVTAEHSKMFTVTHDVKTRGNQRKLYLTHYCTNLRKHFFHERVIAPWNSLKITPDTVQSIATFKCLVNSSDVSVFYTYCNVCLSFLLRHLSVHSLGVSQILYCTCLLWPPYRIGQAIIFLPCGFHLLSIFFSRLISAVRDWMSTILPHMVWP